MDGMRILAETQGFFTRPMAAEFGYNSRSFDAVFRSGLWCRIRHGYYTFADLWGELDQVGRYRLRCQAVMHSLGARVALSHISSLVMQGIDPWGQDLTRVHVTRLDGGAGRFEGAVVHHRGHAANSDLVHVDGLLATRADRAAPGSRLTTRGRSRTLPVQPGASRWSCRHRRSRRPVHRYAGMARNARCPCAHPNG